MIEAARIFGPIRGDKSPSLYSAPHGNILNIYIKMIYAPGRKKFTGYPKMIYVTA